MTVRTKVIGRQPTDHGAYVPGQSYGKKYQVELYYCVWESKHDQNNTAPATLNTSTGVITPNTTDWKKVSGSYYQWLIDNGYKKVSTSNVKDSALNDTQDHINATIVGEIGSDSSENTIKGRIKSLENNVGSGGSVDQRIAAAKNEVIGGATSGGDTLKKIEDRVSPLETAVGTGGSVDERIAAEGAQHYLKSETYTKSEVNGMITTPDQEYVTVTATDQTTAVTDVLPATGEPDTVYRVGNWDGNQYDATAYSEYAWNESTSQYIHLSTKPQIGEVFDISAYHATGGTLAKYADLAAALDGGNNIPQSLQKGGMSVKYIQSSDNKYVQYRLMSDSFNTTVANWQGVDDEPTAGSENLVKSGGVFDAQAQFNVSDNGNVNKIIKELYLPSVNVEQITKVRFFNCVNIGGPYFVGIQFTDNSYTEIASLRKAFSTLAEAQNARKTLFNNGNNYAIIDWNAMPEQTDYAATISANCLTLEFSPTIYSLLKDNEIKDSVTQLSNNVASINNKANKFVFTDNSTCNEIIKELYLPDIQLETITKVRVFRSANISGEYYSGIILAGDGFVEVVTFRKKFSTKTEADAYILPLYEVDGNFVIVDWQSIEDGQTLDYNVNISKLAQDSIYSPTIYEVLQKEAIDNNANDIESSVSSLVGGNYNFIDSKVWYNDNGIAKLVGDQNRCAVKIPCLLNNEFHIETYLNTVFIPGWFIVDEAMNIIESGEKSSENVVKKQVYDVVVSEPSSKYLCVSSTVANKDKFVLINKSTYLFNSHEESDAFEKSLPKLYYPYLLKEKCPETYSHIKNKDKDVTVVLTGTSLTQGNFYVTERADKSKRPPCLFGNDLASSIYDRLIPFYSGQESRSYEHEDLTYNGTWNVINVYGRITIGSTASANGKIAVKDTEADVTTSMTISDIVDSLYNALLQNHPNDYVLVKGSDYVDVGFNDRINIVSYGARQTGVEMILSYPWDDNMKNALTKTSTSNNASVSFIVPQKAKMFNFIYRSSFDGGNCTVSIAEGNGIAEVFDGTNWVEANGHSFSMFEAAPTGTEAAKTKTKGNTCYQKRLKFRNVSTDSATTVTITRSTDRMNVVGIEWTPRNVFLYVINGARGGHQWGINQDNNLEQFQDSDIWEFAPDLILAEITIKNWGGERPKYDPQYFINLTKQAYFNEFNNDARSLYAKSNGYQDCEVIMYNSFLGGGITESGTNITYNSDGSYKLDLVSQATQQDSPFAGQIKDAWENYDAIDGFMASKDACYIPCNRWFERVADKVFENYFESFQGSGASGDTISYDGTHLNDKGVLIWSACIAPIFDI